MSGGSFDYLYSKSLTPEAHYLRDMADELYGLGFPDAARATLSFIAEPPDALREVWRAVEWWRSNDYGRDQAVAAAVSWRDRKPVERQNHADGWLCRCGRFISGAELHRA